ncbi:MAG: amino acid ABC transporter permease, partial [Eubacteriaceae bacterium]|nr:amino acid ABC transporter permease [Eubacteriaceae bacterium]
VVFGVIIGVAVAICRYYAAIKPTKLLKILDKICLFYTTVIRGTPVLVQLLIIYNLTVWTYGYNACFIAFSINSGAYVSEIIRSGINSVNIGQREAGLSLGLTESMTMRKVILPQAIKNILPAIFNEFIALLKETSIAGYVAVKDITKVSDSIKALTYNSLPLYICALAYLAIVVLMTRLQKYMERRLAKSDRG